MTIEIRRATLQDQAGIIDTIKAVYDEYEFGWFPETYHADLYDLKSHYFEADIPFFVAELGGRVVGTGALAFHPLVTAPVTEKTIEVDGFVRVVGTDCSTERLYVHPDARRMGIGRGIMQVILQEAADRGCIGMELWSDKLFDAAHKMYIQMGAEIVGERLCHDPAQSPEWGLYLPVKQ